MPSPTMYETLLRQPLFQGMSRSDLLQAVGHTRFEFGKTEPHRLIVSEGDQATGLIFVTTGMISASCTSADHTYTLEETLHSPWVIQAESLFGLIQRYTRTYTTSTPCNLIHISKEEVVKLSDNFEIIRINLLNMITTRAHKLERQVLLPQPTDVYGKIARFIGDRSLRPGGHKQLRIKMTTLGHAIGESRLTVSGALRALADEGLIEYTRGIVSIPAFERLVQRCERQGK